MKIGDLVRHRAYDTLNVIVQQRDGGLVKVYCVDEDCHYVTLQTVFEAIKTDK